MDADKIKEILENHKAWVLGKGGARANLRYADVTYANLRYADVTYADLTYADLTSADLRSADLTSANLRSANLRSADLRYADLTYANLTYADLTYANLTYADLTYADLRSADLTSANLRYADLRSADLTSANLTYADLTSANLTSANLTSANGISKYITTPLYLLQDQVGKIRAYKLVNAEWQGPYNGGITYEIGKTVYVDEWSEDELEQCAAGINLATLDWCIKEWHEGHHILICEFTARDIVAIPISSDGKFRVKSCKVIREKSLKQLGLVNKDAK